MQYSKIYNLLVIIAVLFLASCASKINIVDGDEVYLKDSISAEDKQITWLTFVEFNGRSLERYHYFDVLSKEFKSDIFEIPSGSKSIQVTLFHDKNYSGEFIDLTSPYGYSQSFDFDVTLYPQETYKAVSEIKNNSATVWLVNSSDIKISQSITKILNRNAFVNEGIINYYSPVQR